MQADLGQRLIFSPDMITTNFRLDMILRSTSQKSLYILELSVLWEAAVDEVHECKRLKYTDLTAEARVST